MRNGMAHIEHEKEVSTEAEACPHCGAIQSSESEWPTVVSVVIITIGLFVIAGLSLLGVIG